MVGQFSCCDSMTEGYSEGRWEGQQPGPSNAATLSGSYTRTYDVVALGNRCSVAQRNLRRHAASPGESVGLVGWVSRLVRPLAAHDVSVRRREGACQWIGALPRAGRPPGRAAVGGKGARRRRGWARRRGLWGRRIDGGWRAMPDAVRRRRGCVGRRRHGWPGSERRCRRGVQLRKQGGTAPGTAHRRAVGHQVAHFPAGLQHEGRAPEAVLLQ
mmetsp:Transcript_5865/g.15057  ORF Transcript_5865/g.15057 Transcript_5865/m.15057 type:complete len:214 (-) Transcript_5865:375-1016(-)